MSNRSHEQGISYLARGTSRQRRALDVLVGARVFAVPGPPQEKPMELSRLDEEKLAAAVGKGAGG